MAGSELRLHESRGPLRHQRLEPDAVHDVERVEDVAFRLRHLLALVVADEAVDVYLPERHLAGEVHAEHHHARDPEEDDVEARHQDARRVVRLEFARPLRPAERGDRPQSR